MRKMVECVAPPSDAIRMGPVDGVLLLHGVTGTPMEMKPLARYLEQRGYRVAVPLLPGHGAGHRALLATTRHDWLDGARRALRELAAACDHIVLVGLCGGGLLNVLLAADDPAIGPRPWPGAQLAVHHSVRGRDVRPTRGVGTGATGLPVGLHQRIAGLVVLSPDLGFRAPGPATPWTRILLPLAYRVPLLKRHGYWTERPPYGLKDPRLQERITRAIVAAKQGQTVEYGTFRMYVGTIYEMEQLHEAARHRASAVTCPALIMHSVEDSLFTIRNATLLYGLLGSQDKTVELVTGCDHVITVDLQKRSVAQAVDRFVQRVTHRRRVCGSEDHVSSFDVHHLPTN